RWLRDHHLIVLFLTPERRRARVLQFERIARDQLDALVLRVRLVRVPEIARPRCGCLRPGAGRVRGAALIGRRLVAGTAFTADHRPFGEQGAAGATVSRLAHQARPFFDDVLLVAVPRSEERRRRIASARRTALSRARFRTRIRLFSLRRSADRRRKERSDSAARSRLCHGTAADMLRRAAMTCAQYSSAAAS